MDKLGRREEFFGVRVPLIYAVCFNLWKIYSKNSIPNR